MKKTRNVIALVLGLISIANSAYAESYKTFVDVLVQNTVSLSISNNNIIDDEVTLNGVDQPLVRTAIYKNSGEAIEVVSSTGKILLSIPTNSKKTKWHLQKKGYFSDGDTRIIKGELVINGIPVSKLVEIFATE